MKKIFFISTLVESGFKKIVTTVQVLEKDFNDLLQAKLKEFLTEENQDQYDRFLKEVTEVLESKKQVTIGNTNFEIKFIKERKS